MATPTARQLKEAAGLSRRKNRDETGLFLVEGWRSVLSAKEAGAHIQQIFRAPSLVVTDGDDALRGERVYDISDREMARLSDVKTPPGILAVVRIPESAHADTLPEKTLVLDGVQDPGNVGTLIRTAAWLGIRTVVLGPDSADPWSPKVVRSTMGGLWDVDVNRVTDLVTWLDRAQLMGASIWTADMDGEPVSAWRPGTPAILVIGSEAHGVSDAVRQRATGAVTIPGPDGKKGVESLNAAIAGGIIMSHWTAT